MTRSTWRMGLFIGLTAALCAAGCGHDSGGFIPGAGGKAEAAPADTVADPVDDASDVEQIPPAELEARNEAFMQTICPTVTDDAPADLQQACLEYDGRAPPPNCSGVVPPDRGPFGKKITVTFDDGPAWGKTDAVLQTLRADHPDVKATFFINGKNVSSSTRPLLDEILLDGHLIANHTNDHVDSSKFRPAGAFKAAQIDATDGEIRAAYARVGIAVPEFLFWRFPYGATNCEITTVVMQNAGYQVTGWHIDTADWCFNSSRGGVGYCHPATFKWVPDSYRDDFPGYTVKQAESKGGGVLLLHDVHNFTVNSLSGLLQKLKDRGFGFARLDDATVFPRLNDGVGVGDPEPADPTQIPFTGTSCYDLSADGKEDYSAFDCVDVTHPNFATGLCDGHEVKGYCPGNWNIKCCTNPAAY